MTNLHVNFSNITRSLSGEGNSKQRSSDPSKIAWITCAKPVFQTGFIECKGWWLVPVELERQTMVSCLTGKQSGCFHFHCWKHQTWTCVALANISSSLVEQDEIIFWDKSEKVRTEFLIAICVVRGFRWNNLPNQLMALWQSHFLSVDSHSGGQNKFNALSSRPIETAFWTAAKCLQVKKECFLRRKCKKSRFVSSFCLSSWKYLWKFVKLASKYSR